MSELDPQMKAKLIVETGLELKADLPICLDMRELTAFADFFVILTGRSDRQVRSIADAIIQTLKARDEEPLGVEGLDDGKWVLIDCNDAIVHVFDAETRVKYDLERLWRDAPRIDLGIPGVDANPEREWERERERGLDADLERDAAEDGEEDGEGDDESGEGAAADPAA